MNRTPLEEARERLARAFEAQIQQPEAKDEDERFALRSKAAAREAGEGPWGD